MLSDKILDAHEELKRGNSLNVSLDRDELVKLFKYTLSDIYACLEKMREDMVDRTKAVDEILRQYQEPKEKNKRW